MSHYYLVSSLPTLTLNGALPFSVEEFGVMCEGVLSEEELSDIRMLLGQVEAAPQTAIVSQWLQTAKLLNQEVARTRADRAGSDLKLVQGFSGVVEPGVAHAFAVSNPGDRERELDTFCWGLADELAATDSYGFAAVVAFAVKLAMVARWSALTVEAGEEKLESLIAGAAELDF